MIYHAQDDYIKGLEYYKQSLSIVQEFGDRDSEAIMSRNIGLTYKSMGDLAQAELSIAATSRPESLEVEDFMRIASWLSAREDR